MAIPECGPGWCAASPVPPGFFFLFEHVLDAALVRVSPQAYNEVIETFKTPIVRLMEVGLVAAVLYHSLDGIRVMLIDFWRRVFAYLV